MSSSKRRKLEGEGLPQSPVSAVSAIAARRRLTTPAAQNSEPVESPEPLTPRTNSFSALQTLKPSREGKKSPKKSSQQTPQRRNEGYQRADADTLKAASQSSDTKPPIISTSSSPSSSQVINFSSFRLNKSNCRTKAAGVLELRLDESERFLILGAFGIRVINGEISLAGAVLRPADNVYWVHSPHCLALPVIRTTEETRIELHDDPNLSNLRKLGRLSPLFRGIWNEKSKTVDGTGTVGKSFQIIGSSVDAPKRCVIQELASPPEWNKKLASLLPSSPGANQRTTFVCGPKSAGKSTFSRLLTNRLLTFSSNGQTPVKRVAVLDLDPGQPEYAPSGTVSLVSVSRPNFGAPFTHVAFEDSSNTILRCHALASVTPASAPDLFISCAIDLYETYQRSMKTCPLIINTPGWILGTGLDLLVNLITRMRPTEVIYMSEDGPADVVDVLKDATKNTFSLLPSQPSEFTSRTAAHFRSMQMMSYYHSHIDPSNKSSNQPRLTWSTRPLTSIRPYVVSYHGNSSGILGILSYDYQSPPELLAASINGSILAIVEIEEPGAFQEFDSVAGQEDQDSTAKHQRVAVSRTAEDLPFIFNPNDAALDPRYCKAIGLALIRGIDSRSKCLQVITPTPMGKLEQIRSEGRDVVLVHGKFDTPHWAYTEDLYDKSTQDELPDRELQITDEETSEDEAEDETTQAGRTGDNVRSNVPWIEILKGNQRRPVGSRVWRVRRDLGRHNTD